MAETVRPTQPDFKAPVRKPESDGNDFTFQAGEKNFVFPQQDSYDLTAIMEGFPGMNRHLANYRLGEAIKTDPTIRFLYERKKGRPVLFDRPNLKKIVTAINEGMNSMPGKQEFEPVKRINSTGEEVALYHPDDLAIIDELDTAKDQGESTIELAITIGKDNKPTPHTIQRVYRAIGRLRTNKFHIKRVKGENSSRYIYGETAETNDSIGKQNTRPSTKPTPFNPAHPKVSPKSQEGSASIPNNVYERRSPQEILSFNSVHLSLSHLANGTLEEVNKDISVFLQEIVNNKLPTSFKKGLQLTDILPDASPSRLNRSFSFWLRSTLGETWDKEVQPDTPNEEKQIIEEIKKLKDKPKPYNKKGVVQEVLGHFGIIVPPENV